MVVVHDRDKSSHTRHKIQEISVKIFILFNTTKKAEYAASGCLAWGLGRLEKETTFFNIKCSVL